MKLSQNTKERLGTAFYLLAVIGILDMTGQAMTDGQFKLIHMSLGLVFGTP